MEGLTSKKTKEQPKHPHKDNMKFLNLLLSWEAYEIRKGKDLLKGGLA
jgi:hypothetical protein